MRVCVSNLAVVDEHVLGEVLDLALVHVAEQQRLSGGVGSEQCLTLVGLEDEISVLEQETITEGSLHREELDVDGLRGRLLEGQQLAHVRREGRLDRRLVGPVHSSPDLLLYTGRPIDNNEGKEKETSRKEKRRQTTWRQARRGRPSVVDRLRQWTYLAAHLPRIYANAFCAPMRRVVLRCAFGVASQCAGRGVRPPADVMAAVRAVCPPASLYL